MGSNVSSADVRAVLGQFRKSKAKILSQDRLVPELRSELRTIAARITPQWKNTSHNSVLNNYIVRRWTRTLSLPFDSAFGILMHSLKKVETYKPKIMYSKLDYAVLQVHIYPVGSPFQLPWHPQLPIVTLDQGIFRPAWWTILPNYFHHFLSCLHLKSKTWLRWRRPCSHS